MGSLAGAVHLLYENEDVLRYTPREQKSLFEEKAKSVFYWYFQCEYPMRKQGLSILCLEMYSGQRCQKSYQRDNWLVAAKRS